MTSRRTFLSRLKQWCGKSSALRRHLMLVLRIYDQLEHHIQHLKKKTNLQCVEGCGRCCDNPRVEASILECLPLAVDLWMKGEAEEKLKALDGAENKVCVFFKPDPLVPGHGRCTVYAYRPLICRLYGFAANRDKKNNPIFVGCPMISEAFSKEYESAEILAEKKSTDVPVMSDYGAQIDMIDPDLARRKVNINLAVKEALQKVGLQVKLKNDL